MKLKQYLQIKKIKQREFANELGISLVHFNRGLNGNGKFGVSLAKHIVAKCEGNVSLKDIMEPESAEDLEVLLQRSA